jgi:DNA-binding helix-hairpin-helix protein with protein kinase domain
MVTIGADVRLVRSGRNGRVVRLLGEGGQGSVYAVDLGVVGEVALKWYHDANATDHQRRVISELIERGAPSTRFLWPQELVSSRDDVRSFGYVMPLRPTTYVGVDALLRGKVSINYSTVATLCMNLADAFFSLHSQGLCYCDISFGNLFFEPTTGVPLICDNDNIGIDGHSDSAVLGTMRFMAPEVVRREAMPSRRTDLYSLSVLLFYVLMVGHPLIGQRQLDYPFWDQSAEEDLLGRRPLFVFDPTDASNKPIDSDGDPVSYNWQVYPRFIRDLFLKAFTRGLVDPVNGRVAESVWRSAMSRMRDSVVRCSSCDRENLFDEERPSRNCWRCGDLIALPVRLDVGGHSVVLNETTRIYAHHLLRNYDFTTAVAEVVRHPERPQVWGLRNCGQTPWTTLLPDGTTAVVEPNRSLSLIPGTEISVAGRTLTLV